MTKLSPFSNYAARLREFIGAPLSPEERFNELAVELFALQFEQNEPYRRFCEFRYINPRMIARWTQIPAMPTSAFKELELTSLPSETRSRVFYSSGATQENRSRHFHSTESLSIYEASLLPWFRAHLLPEHQAMRFVNLTPMEKDAPNSSLVHMFETVRREAGSVDSVFTGTTGKDGTWGIDFDRTLEVLREASAAKTPVVLLGTAFNFVLLLDWLEAQRLQLNLPKGSRAMETGGYKGRTRSVPKDELLEAIENWLGIPRSQVVSEYGMSELSSQAYDGVAGRESGERVFRFPPWARAQLVSAETGREVGEGETGLIRVFELANMASVMAVQTEDLGVRRGEGFELLGRAAAAEMRGCSLMSR